jgi:hypothetical protein
MKSSQYNKENNKKNNNNNKKGPQVDDRGKICPRDKFFALSPYLATKQGFVIKESFGLPENLTKDDHKKHGNLYVSLFHIQQLSELCKKKFGTDTIPPVILEFAKETEKKYADVLPVNSYITGEVMGSKGFPIWQKTAYNTMKGPGVVLHGSLELEGCDTTIITPKIIEDLCESFHAEGFVFVTKDGRRAKAKRCCFSSEDGLGQKGEHLKSPVFNTFTKEGLILCDNEKNGDDNENYGYDNAALKGVTERTIIAETNGISLVVLPYADVIKKQLDNIFEGEKMFNAPQTDGTAKMFHYVMDAPLETDLEGAIIEVKHNGETVILHKDANGQFHLMVKLQVYVWTVVEEDGSFKYELGWGVK